MERGEFDILVQLATSTADMDTRRDHRRVLGDDVA
jgi:hypothetical protein